MLITATITFFILMLSLVAAVAYRMWDREGLLSAVGRGRATEPAASRANLPEGWPPIRLTG